MDPVQETFSYQSLSWVSNDARTSFRFAVLISESISNHSKTWLPAMPGRHHAQLVLRVEHFTDHDTGNPPLNCICIPGAPPKMAMEVLWRSFMSVLNMAQVDAQFALPTMAIFSGGKKGSAGRSTLKGQTSCRDAS